MTKQWNDGPPPSIGWWPVRLTNGAGMPHLRWWNGGHWSAPAWPSNSVGQAGEIAKQFALRENREIQWATRPSTWPARSRT